MHGFLCFPHAFGIPCSFSKAGCKLFISLDADVCVSDTWRKITPPPRRALVDAALLPGVSVGLATLLPQMAQQWGRSAATGGSWS